MATSSGHSTSRRKDDHVRVVLAGQSQSSLSTGLERWSCRHRALPEIDMEDVDLSVEILGRPVSAPVFVACMTGGSSTTGALNQRMARVADRMGLAFGLGSIRGLLESPSQLDSYDVRPMAGNIPLLANIGLSDVGIDDGHLLRTCEDLDVDGLVVHLNCIQEAVQTEGNGRFRQGRDRIARLVDRTSMPIWVKEVGFGMDEADVRALIDAGVVAVDVAGAGGTNWALVEANRSIGNSDSGLSMASVGQAFADWGWPTASAILNATSAVRRSGSDCMVIASGGLRSGVDVAKALCLGASLGSMAGSVIGAAAEGEESFEAVLRRITTELRIACFAMGKQRVVDLGRDDIVLVDGERHAL